MFQPWPVIYLLAILRTVIIIIILINLWAEDDLVVCFTGVCLLALVCCYCCLDFEGCGSYKQIVMG